jgi:hypothetical protein
MPSQLVAKLKFRTPRALRRTYRRDYETRHKITIYTRSFRLESTPSRRKERREGGERKGEREEKGKERGRANGVAQSICGYIPELVEGFGA